MAQSDQPTVQGSYTSIWTWFSLASPQYRFHILLPGHGSVWPAHSTGFLSLYLGMVQSRQPTVPGSYPSTWTWFSLASPQYMVLSLYLGMVQSDQPTVRVPIPLPGHDSVWPAHSTGFLSLLHGRGSVWPAHSTGFLSLYLDMVQSSQPTVQGSNPRPLSPAPCFFASLFVSFSSVHAVVICGSRKEE
jgi:hypothetical protein